MSATRCYLSGAFRRKQRKARLQNETKNRQTFEKLGRGIRTTQEETNTGERNGRSSFEGETSNTSFRKSISEEDYQTDPNESGQESLTQQEFTVKQHNKISQQSEKSTFDCFEGGPSRLSFWEFISDKDQFPQTASQQFHLPTSTSDPATWKHLTQAQRDIIVQNGPSGKLHCFPRDSCGRRFPGNIFFSTLPNGEQVHRDWFVWSSSVQGLFCFPCCVFQGFTERGQNSQLARSEAGVKGCWRKLYKRIETQQRNSVHISRYCDWKSLEAILRKPVGIDSAVEKQLDAETAKFWDVF